MYKEEKLRVLEKLALKNINIMNTYNLLQDMRHLIILDFRPQDKFSSSRIRKAIHTDLESYEKEIQSAIATKSEKCKTHYEGDTLKRILFIFPKEEWKTFEQKISKDISNLDVLIN